MWIEGDGLGDGDYRSAPNDKVLQGRVWDIKNRPLEFNARQWHCAEPWSGESRWTITAFTPLMADRYLHEWRDVLQELGFRLPSGCKVEDSWVSSVEVPGVEDEHWEISFPKDWVTSEIMTGHEVRHEALSVMCREWAADLSVADPADVVYEATVETLKALALER